MTDGPTNSRSAFAALNFLTLSSLVKRAIADIGVPVNPENVVIQKGGGDVTIGVNYTVHVDAMLHPFDMDFHPAAKNGGKIDPLPANRMP